MLPLWFQQAKQYMPTKYQLIINGYVKNVQKLSLYSTVPTTITTLILIYTYYFKPIIPMLNLTKVAKSEDEISSIISNITKLLQDYDDWDKSIIENIVETKSIHFFLNKINYTNNKELAESLSWLLAATDVKYSVLMHSKPQNQIFKIIQKWQMVFPVLVNIMSILASMTRCSDLTTKNQLIKDGILNVLFKQIDKLFFMENYHFGYSSLEYIEMISLTFRNITANRRAQKVQNYGAFTSILCLTLSKLYKLYVYLEDELTHECNHWYTDYCNNLLGIIKLGFKNVSTAFCQLIQNNYEMLDFIMLYRLTGNTGNILTDCINLLAYPNSAYIRHQFMRIFVIITADPESSYVQHIIDLGICEKIIEIFNQSALKFKVCDVEICNMLLLLSNIFASDYQWVMYMIKDNEIIDIILHYLQNNNAMEQIKNNSLTCINNALLLQTPEVTLRFLSYKNGLIIDILCSLLDNDDNIDLKFGKNISNEIECLHLVVTCTKAGNFDGEFNTNWMEKRFKQQNIAQILNKLKFIKSDNDSHTSYIDEEYLTTLGLKRFQSSIQYLSELI